MGKKKTGAMPTSPPKREKKLVINMTKAELAKDYKVPGFRTGKYMTEKDRPRNKSWKKEYAKQRKGSEQNNTSDSFSFLRQHYHKTFQWILVPKRILA